VQKAVESLASQLSRPPPNLLLNPDILAASHQRFRFRKIYQTGKYEADQIFHSTDILLAMTG